MGQTNQSCIYNLKSVVEIFERMTEEELIELDEKIDNYLNKKLSKEEEEKFTAELKNDPGLREKVRRNEVIRDLVIDYNLVKLRERMKALFASREVPGSGRKAFPKDKKKIKQRKKAD